MKIKTKANARYIADLMVAGNFQKWYCPGYSTEKPFIQLWDNEVGNRLMIVIREEVPWNYTVAFTDTVRDTELFQSLMIHEIADCIWNYRKFINHSGQIDNI